MAFWGVSDVEQYAIDYGRDGGLINNQCPQKSQAISFFTANLFKAIAASYGHDEEAFLILGTNASVQQRLRRIYCHKTGGGASCNALS